MCRKPGCTALDTCNCGPTVTATPVPPTSVPVAGQPPKQLPVSGAPLPTVGLIGGGIITIIIGVLGLLAL